MRTDIDLEQEIEALESNLETACEQRDELIDLIEELLNGRFLKLDKWAEEARDTTGKIKRGRS